MAPLDVALRVVGFESEPLLPREPEEFDESSACGGDADGVLLLLAVVDEAVSVVDEAVSAAVSTLSLLEFSFFVDSSKMGNHASLGNSCKHINTSIVSIYIRNKLSLTVVLGRNGGSCSFVS